MENYLGDTKALLLSGKEPMEVVSYLEGQGYRLGISYTHDKINKDKVEERVIRIMRKKDELEVLVGFFQMPQYILRKHQ